MDIGQPASRAGLAPGRSLLQRLRPVALAAALLAALAGSAWFLHRFFTLVVVDDARIAADMITISSRVPGWVAEVKVIAGDTPSHGSLLVRIDSRESEIALREIEARPAGIAARRAELEARLAMVDLQTSSAEAGSRAKLEVAR